MSSKYVPPPMKSATPKMPTVTPLPSHPPQVSLKSSNGSTITKFLPFICAGAAVGVSILALKELKKIKAEMVLVKNQQNNVQVSKPTTDPLLSKKMEQLEEQLKLPLAVSYNGSTTAFDAVSDGSIPSTASNGPVAQLVEPAAHNSSVVGSNPAAPIFSNTKNRPRFGIGIPCAAGVLYVWSDQAIVTSWQR